MGGGDVLNAEGQALPEVKAVADLHGAWGASGDALPVGEGAVTAGDLNTGAGWGMTPPVVVADAAYGKFPTKYLSSTTVTGSA